MLTIDEIKKLDEEPWLIKLGQRISDLKRLIHEKEKICVLLYRSPDTSTFRYRCYNIVQATREFSGWKFVFFFENELECLETYLEEVACITLVRMPWTRRLARFVNRAEQKGARIVFDIDDLVFDLRYLETVMNQLSIGEREEDYAGWAAMFSRNNQTARLASVFTATNEYLGQKLHEAFGQPYHIIKNSLNDEQVYTSTILRSLRERKQEIFNLGYFSGTPTHMNDFKTISGELAGVLHAHNDIRLHIVGFMELPRELAVFVESGQIISSPHVGFIELQEKISMVDINLIPLVDSVFSDCKSELKYFEAAIVDVASIASPTQTLKKAIQHGQTGFIAQRGEWKTIIERLYRQRDILHTVAENARESALKEYYGNGIAKQVNSAYSAMFE